MSCIRLAYAQGALKKSSLFSTEAQKSLIFSDNSYIFYKENVLKNTGELVMYRIAIVDDDYMVRESTKAVIERNFKEENFQVECFSTFSQLQSELPQELFTVYILDIELPDGNGLELAKEIRKIQERAYIVFLTAYEKYALSGYEVRAFHYIIKENMEKKLVQTMRQICREIGIHVKGQYLVKRAGVFEKVALREICYIYKEQKNSIFVTLQGKKANRESLKEVAGKLPKEQFVIAERGYIVNLLHVERLEKGMLTMDNGDLIKVGRGHNREIMQKMSEYMERGWG